MTYILLAIGIIVTLAAGYRFLTRATRKQIGTLIIVIATVAITGIILLLAITGRLPAIVGGIAALWPLLYSVWQSHKSVRREERIYNDIKNSPGPMSESEAREILGVSKNAKEEEIETAYKNLMKKIHPDSGGSDWMTKKLNAARDKLLKK